MNLDGTSDSKPIVETSHVHTNTPKLEHKPTKLRRFMSIGSRGSKPTSRTEMNNKPGNTPPLQTLSPRPTEFEPRAKKQTKRSISTFLLSKPFSINEHEPQKDDGDTSTAQGHVPVTETASLSLPQAATKEDGDNVGSQGHLPVTGNPYRSVQSQPRKDSATKSFYDRPLSASRTAALTSHPVGKGDLESEEAFKTPRVCSGRQTGDYVEK